LANGDALIRLTDCFGAQRKSAYSPMRVQQEKKQISKVNGFNVLVVS